MDIHDAFDIVTPLTVARPVGTAHLHDKRLRDVMKPAIADPIERACTAGYGLALHEFEANATVLRAFLRGMVDAEGVQHHIEKCRALLSEMEAALSAGDCKDQREAVR